MALGKQQRIESQPQDHAGTLFITAFIYEDVRSPASHFSSQRIQILASKCLRKAEDFLDCCMLIFKKSVEQWESSRKGYLERINGVTQIIISLSSWHLSQQNNGIAETGHD